MTDILVKSEPGVNNAFSLIFPLWIERGMVVSELGLLKGFGSSGFGFKQGGSDTGLVEPLGLRLFGGDFLVFLVFFFGEYSLSLSSSSSSSFSSSSFLETSSRFLAFSLPFLLKNENLNFTIYE